MPATEFLMREPDFRPLVEELMSYNVTVVPRLRCPSPEYMERNSVDDVLYAAYNYDNASPIAVLSPDDRIELLVLPQDVDSRLVRQRYGQPKLPQMNTDDRG